jgi:hypothetical protein
MAARFHLQMLDPAFSSLLSWQGSLFMAARFHLQMLDPAFSSLLSWQGSLFIPHAWRYAFNRRYFIR